MTEAVDLNAEKAEKTGITKSMGLAVTQMREGQMTVSEDSEAKR